MPELARFLFAMVFAWFAFPAPAQTVLQKSLPGHVPPVVRNLNPIGVLPDSRQLRLSISLPLRNRELLTNLLEQLYDPDSPEFHKYLMPQEFTGQFGPSEQDYRSVMEFAKANHLQISGTHDSRMVVDLQGTVSNIQNAFHIQLRNYQHPTEPRQFYAPDTEPLVDSTLPVEHILGLSDWARPRPAAHKISNGSRATPNAGSAPSGNYMGSDFRNAYAAGVALTGAGQSVGLLEFDGYYASDITAYESLAGLPAVPLANVYMDGGGGTPGSDNSEVALDIEMAISMAPGVTSVVVFEASNNDADDSYWYDLLNAMAASNQIKQFSASWTSDGSTSDTSFDPYFQRLAMQGQSFFQASGDGDAWVNPIQAPCASPYVTSVGGTTLTMGNSGGVYKSEQVWNWGDLGASEAWTPNGDGYWGSGGGVSSVYSIPSWQSPVSMTANHGSTTMRNIPDVALTGDEVWVISDDGSSGSFGGTSCAAPLWAGFAALVNQQAAANGRASLGFPNPAIYAIGQGTNYHNCFHDIIYGNDTNSGSPNNYFAVPGYDLGTGWGTPAGQPLINALAGPDALSLVPAAGLTAYGFAGGPFSNSSVTIRLTNGGTSNLNWACGNASPWLKVTPTNGTLTPGGSGTAVTISLNPTVTNYAVGYYATNLWFTNKSDGVAQSLQNLLLVNPPFFRGAYAATVLSHNPVGYWQLNETNVAPAADVVTNSGSLGSLENGSPFNSVAQGRAGIVSNCCTFSNSDLDVTYLGTYVDIPNNSVLNPSGPFTVEFWAKPNQSPTDFFCPVSSIDDTQDANASRFGWVFYEASGNEWNFRVGNASGYAGQITGGTVQVNAWQHVAGVYDGTNVTLYVNGALAAGPSSASGFVPNTNPAVTLRIGATSFGNRTFDGSVDELVVYTNALAAGVISAHYHAASTNNAGYGSQILASHPVGYWRLDEPAYNAVPSSQLPVAVNLGSASYLADGIYQPGCVTGSPGVPGVGFGTPNYACVFGSRSYIDVPGTVLAFTGPLTLSAWVKTGTLTGQTQTIAGLGASSYQLSLNGAGYPQFSDGAQAFGSLTGTNPVTDNQWHQLAGVYDGTNSECLYVDGRLVSESTSATALPAYTGNDFYIGGDPDPGVSQFFNGAVDEVAVFTNALTSSQMLWLFSTGSSATLLSASVNSPVAGKVNLSWLSIPGQVYQLEYKTNLTQTNWVLLGAAVTATNPVQTATDMPGASSPRYYRVLLLP